MFRWLAWVLERDVPPAMSTPTQERALTQAEIDEVLSHWARKIHTDPDPLNRWASLVTIDRWLDARLRLHELTKDDEQTG